MVEKKERGLFQSWSPEKLGSLSERLSAGRGFYEEQEAKQNKEIKGRRL